MSAFDFPAFIKSVHDAVNGRIDGDINVDFRSYLEAYCHTPDKGHIDACALICETILRNEFDLTIDSRGFAMKGKIHSEGG